MLQSPHGKEKITLDALATNLAKMDAYMRNGFVKQGKEIHDLTSSVARIVMHMARKEDVVAIERRLHARIDSLKVKVDGMQNTLDREAVVRSDQKIPERVTKLQEKVFGRSRA
jgi:hypothetical protein